MKDEAGGKNKKTAKGAAQERPRLHPSKKGPATGQ